MNQNSLNSNLNSTKVNFVDDPGTASALKRQEGSGEQHYTIPTSTWYKLVCQGQGAEVKIKNGESIMVNSVAQRQTMILPLKSGMQLTVKCTAASTWAAIFSWN